MLKNIVMLSSITLLLILAGCSSDSDSAGTSAPEIITATYTGTISGSSAGSEYAVDQNYTVSIVLDNNDSSLISQTWTSDDVVSITYSINNDSNIITVFSPVVFTSTGGNFTTDADGNLTSVPSSWNDASGLSTVVQTNDPYAGAGQFYFYINGINGVYTPDSWTHYLYDVNVTQDIDPAHWTISLK